MSSEKEYEPTQEEIAAACEAILKQRESSHRKPDKKFRVEPEPWTPPLVLREAWGTVE